MQKKTSINELAQRVTHIEEEIRHLPSANDVTELRVALVEMKGEAKELRTETKMLRHLVALLTEKEVKK